MPAPYPEMNFSDSANVYSIFKYINSGVSGVFMPLSLLAIWVIAFIGSISEGREAARAWVFASFVCSILAILLSLIGMLNPQYMYFLFLMTAGGLIWYKLSTAPGM